MAQKSADSVHILEGKAILYKREGSPAWQVRYRIGRQKLRNTTNETDLDKAKARAVDIVMNAMFREKNQLPVVNKHFKAVAELAIKRMEEANEAGHGKATYKTYIQALENYHIPYLGKYLITNLDYATLERFSKWREDKLKRRPSASTINSHNSALGRVFDEALMRGYITKSQVPELSNQGVKGERRPSFTEAEYKKIYLFMRKWAPAGRRGHERTMRMLLRDYVLILANTGLRAGTETMNLKWQHISIIEHNGKRYLEMTVRGKTGKRTILVRHRVARYLQRIQERDPKLNKMTFHEVLDKGIDHYVFRVNDNDQSTQLGKIFGRMLKACGLLIDKQTETKRTLYSLRHFYATRTLTRTDITPYQLAEFMGTSVGMIKAHYGHLDLRNIADKFAGTDTTIDMELKKPRLVDDDEDESEGKNDGTTDAKSVVKRATRSSKTTKATKTASAKRVVKKSARKNSTD